MLMKKNIKLILSVILIGYLIILGCFTFLDYEYKRLAVDNQNKHTSCAIVYMSQHDTENDVLNKLKSAKKWLADNKKNKIIYSPFVVNDHQNSLKLLNKANIDKSNVLPDYYSVDMKTSVQEAYKIMQKNHYQTCNVIAFDYEMKRYLKYFKRNHHIDLGIQNVYKQKQSYLKTESGRSSAEKEIYALPKLWLNQ